MSFEQILTQPIIQEIVKSFDPTDWSRWNKLCRKTRRLSTPFLPYLMEMWVKKCPELLPTDKISVLLHGYVDNTEGKITVYECPYIFTPKKSQSFIGTGYDRCGCTNNGKVGIKFNKVHGNVYLRKTHSDKKLEYHGHYNMGTPIVTFSWINTKFTKRVYSQVDSSIVSDTSIDRQDDVLIHLDNWNNLNGSLVDPTKCEICHLLNPLFPVDTI